MAVFTDTKYESDSGDIHGIRLSPERAAVAGAPPAGDVSSPIKALVSKTNRSFGIRPRGVVLSRVIGTAPDTFKKYSFLPVLTPAAFVTATFAIGATITIDGTEWTIASKQSEDY